jgi:hypothetical protein
LDSSLTAGKKSRIVNRLQWGGRLVSTAPLVYGAIQQLAVIDNPLVKKLNLAQS